MNLSPKVIIQNDAGKILSLRRSKTDPVRSLMWDFPGGLIEESEDLNLKTLEKVIKSATKSPGLVGAK